MEGWKKYGTVSKKTGNAEDTCYRALKKKVNIPELLRKYGTVQS
jgi:hypothetical protein